MYNKSECAVSVFLSTRANLYTAVNSGNSCAEA